MVAEQRGCSTASAEMAEYVQRVGEQPSELPVEEWSLLPLVYKNAVSNRRAAWRVITSVEKKETSKGDEQLVSNAREYVEKVEGELQKIRDGILALMDKKLVPSASTDETKVSYYKMKSDYYRYLAEFATGETKSKAGEEACDACVEANKIAENDLAVTHPVRLAVDTKFLRSLKTRCSETNEKFDRRVADRQVELKAVIDAIGILNSDTSFDTYDKTVSTDFLQMSPLAGEQALRQRALSVLRDAINKVVDDPVVQVPQAHVAGKTVEIPQSDVVKKIVKTPGIQQCNVEQIVDTPVLPVVEELAEISKAFSQNRVQQRFGGQTVETPAVSLAEKIIEIPVTRTQDKTQHVVVVNTHVQHAVNAVEAEKPIINETINQVTRHVEIPQLQIVEKTMEAAKHIQQERVQNNTVQGSQTQDETVEVIQPVLQDQMSDHVFQHTVKELRSKFEVGHMSEVHARNRSDKNRWREKQRFKAKQYPQDAKERADLTNQRQVLAIRSVQKTVVH